MAGLIKKEILKHLSKFVKNLSLDKINLSMLKGEGELTNLELDETVLMDVMELPSWLAIKKANCNRVSLRIPWTKLKTTAICLFLDHVEVELEVCEQLRSFTEKQQQLSSGVGKYGFVERVIDGLYISVNSVSAGFRYKNFNASFQLSRMQVQSTSSQWQPGDLRVTRIKDEDRGLVLVFKEISWSTLRIEVNAQDQTGCPTSRISTPIRMISNQSRVRITIKKRLADCAIASSKVVLILDDLLWVLSDSQIKAFLTYIESLIGVIEKSSERSKQHAGEILQERSLHNDIDNSCNNSNTKTVPTSISRYFDLYDIIETSYHLLIKRIDLHLCDDASSTAEKCQSRVEGGAVQLTLHKLSIDHYPFHIAGSSRSHWERYNDTMDTRNTWATHLMVDFKRRLKAAMRNTDTPHDLHSALQRFHLTESFTESILVETRRRHKPGGGPQASPKRTPSSRRPPRTPKMVQLLASASVLRVDNFEVFAVTSSASNKNTNERFLYSDKKTFHLPPEFPSFHLDFTEYFLPSEPDCPVPDPNLFIQINPCCVRLDYLTILWLNQFYCGLCQTVESLVAFSASDDQRHTDIRLEALMPKVIMPAEVAHVDQINRPHAVEICASKLSITNAHIDKYSLIPNLNTALSRIGSATLTRPAPPTFPSQEGDFRLVPEIFTRFQTPGHRGNLRKSCHDDVMSVNMEQFWVDYTGIRSVRGGTFPFIDSVPLTVWMHRSADDPASPPSPDLDLKSDGFKDTLPEIPCRDILTNNKRVLKSSQLPRFASVDEGAGRKGAFPDREIRDRIYSLPINELVLNEGFLDGVAKRSHTFPLTDLEEPHDPLRKNAPPPLTDLREGDPPDPGGSTTTPTAAIALVIDTESVIAVNIDHDQYLFLLRLVESVSGMLLDIQTDAASILGPVFRTHSTSVVSNVQQIDLTLMLPVSVPDRLESAEVLAEFGRCVDSPSDPGGRTGVAASSPSDNLDEEIDDANALAQLSNNQYPPPPPPTNQYPPPQLPNNKSDPVISVSFSHTADDANVDLSNIVTFQKQTENKARTKQNGACHRSPSYSNLDPFRAGFDQFRGNLDQLRGTLDPFRYSMSATPSSFDDHYDTLSVTSTGSDSDSFIFIESDGLLRRTGNVTSDIFNEDSTGVSKSETESSVSSERFCYDRRNDSVAVHTFRVYDVMLGVQTSDMNTSVKTSIGGVVPASQGNITYEQFHMKQVNKKPDGAVTTDPLHPVVDLRLDIGPLAMKYSPQAVERGHLHVRSRDLTMELVMSLLSSVGDFIEDEKLAAVMPMTIEADNINLTLQEDRPCRNATSPGPVPIDLHLVKCLVTRTDDGLFHINMNEAGDESEDRSEAVTVETPCSTPKELVKLHHLEEDNGTLQQRVEELEARVKKMSEESEGMSKVIDTLSDELWACQSENASLRNRLKSAIK